ncbi:PTB/PI domain [Trinorchestia longiramus]|nr:PTB/PI domain [Trinorchestia longiramus]
MSFLKSIFNSNKHKKLSEEWTNSREPVVDGVTFYVRYLGSSLVEDPKCAQSTTAGVKRVIHAAKAGARPPERVALRVAMEGVRIDSTLTGETIMDTSIYKISYCSADSQYEQILAFVASNEDDRCECHAFLCSKRKVAEAIAVSIAQAFTMAYECWKLAIEAKKNGETSLTSEEAMHRDALSSRGRCSKDSNNSRASSPEHSPGCSSPPSEVSSTSGYQSSTACGLLLELDDGDSGSGGLEIPEQTQLGLPTSEVTRPREHWTSFDDVSELADDFIRLNSDPALNCFQTTACMAGAKTSGKYALESSGKCTQSPVTLVQALSRKVDLTSKYSEATSSVPSVDTSVAASAHYLQTQSSSSSLLPTEQILGENFSPASKVNIMCPNLSNLKYTRASRYNDTNQRKVVTKLTEPFFHSNLTSNSPGVLKSNVTLSSNIAKKKSSINFDRTSIAGLNREEHETFERISSVQISRSDWESFDSSPPSQPASPLALSLSSKCSGLPIDSSFKSDPFLEQSNFHKGSSYSSESSYPLTSPAGTTGLYDAVHGAVSPTTAFLDSCLTPRSEGENGEKRFEFTGRLSGEERNFSYDFNSAVFCNSGETEISKVGNRTGTNGSKAKFDKNSKIANTIYSPDAMANVQNGQKGFQEPVR